MEKVDNTQPSAVTAGIRVSVRSIFLPEQTNAHENNYVFAYRINIKNESLTTIQLLRRYWDICDGLGNRKVVSGDGVIGRQPIIQPGEEYTYTSGTSFQTPIGKMSGFYTMLNLADNSEFNVQIPTFLLICKQVLCN